MADISLITALLRRHDKLVPVAFVLIAIFLVAGLLHHHTEGGLLASLDSTRWRAGWIDIDDGRVDRVIRIKGLHIQLQERFGITAKTERSEMARAWNLERLDALAECIAHSNCGPHQEKVVVLASGHFGSSHFGGVAGEDIWALSVADAVESLGYTALYCFGHTEAITMWLAIPDNIVLFLMERSIIDTCVERSPSHLENHKTHGDFGEWQHNRIGCIKRPGYEEGIPLWKIHSFHGWSSPGHPLGANFTVSLEPFRYLGQGSNYYIGYSIEERCRQIPQVEHKEHRALILGKNAEYFKAPNNVFAGMIGEAAKTVPTVMDNESSQAFHVVAVAGNGVDLPEPGVVNLGFKPRDEWYQEVAKSKMMIGIGYPPQSPSPYDALCLGVPFINPIKDWDRERPSDRTRWRLQQPALVDEQPPYVYHVFARDEKGLQDAMQQAAANPIDPYIPPRMTIEAMRARMEVFLNLDWLAEAEQFEAKMIELDLLY